MPDNRSHSLQSSGVNRHNDKATKESQSLGDPNKNIMGDTRSNSTSKR
jgi:hypothetical protein